MRSERHPDKLWDVVGIRAGAAARLDHEPDVVRGDAPGGTFWLAAVGQGALAPARVGETEAVVLVGHVETGRVDNGTSEARLQGGLPALGLQNGVHRSHRPLRRSQPAKT